MGKAAPLLAENQMWAHDDGNNREVAPGPELKWSTAEKCATGDDSYYYLRSADVAVLEVHECQLAPSRVAHCGSHNKHLTTSPFREAISRAQSQAYPNDRAVMAP